MWSMRNSRFALPGLVLFAVAAIPAGASGPARPNGVRPWNGGGLDTHLFRPALDSRGLLAVNGVDVLRSGSVSLGLVIDYGRGILRVPDVGQKSTTLIDNSFAGTLHFNYGIGNRAVVGISAPVILMSGE